MRKSTVLLLSFVLVLTSISFSQHLVKSDIKTSLRSVDNSEIIEAPLELASKYSNKMDPNIGDIQPAIFSGLISAIGAIGKQLFKEDIARISYGEKYEIGIITKELYGDKKLIWKNLKK